MREITVAGSTTRVDSEHRICLDDLHRAAWACGHDFERCRVAHYLCDPGAKRLMKELHRTGELPAGFRVSGDGLFWGCWLIAIDYLEWVEFDLPLALYLGCFKVLPPLELDIYDPATLAEVGRQLQAIWTNETASSGAPERLESGQ